MEEEQVKIKKIVTTIDGSKKRYFIDVDETTTFYELKKILAAAAHLLKNSFQIYYEEKECTNDSDDKTIKEMFPDKNIVILHIISNKDIYQFEDELISVQFKINVPCDLHIGKYKMLYCFKCNKSICSECLSQDHRNHYLVEEKADYLAPAQILMNKIFSNFSIYKADSRLSKYRDCLTYRSNLKTNIFDNLRKLINDLEIKFASCLEYFSTSEDETEKNTNDNIELLKKYCKEYFIKLKNDIKTKDIIIDDEIFLAIYNKLKDIEKYKNKFFEENKKKYEKLNTLFEPFIKHIEQISEELTTTFNTYINKEIYENFKNLIKENTVKEIEKKQVHDLMFREIEVPRKSLNGISLRNAFLYKTEERKNCKSPDKFFGNKKQDITPFQRENYSLQRQRKASNQLLGYNSLSIVKNNRQNNFSFLTWNKNDVQNETKKRLSIIEEKNDINIKEDINGMYQNLKMFTTTTNANNMDQFGGIKNCGGVSPNIKRNYKKAIITNMTNIKNRNDGSYMKSFLNNNYISNTKFNKNMNIVIEENNYVNNNNFIDTSNDIINNYNILKDNTNESDNIQKETTIHYTTETNVPRQISISEQEYNIHNIDNILPKFNEVQNNIIKNETIKTTIKTTRSYDLIEYNNNMNTINKKFNNNINKNISSSNHSRPIKKLTSSNQQANQASENIFRGTLIQVLNGEIKKNDREIQKENFNENITNENNALQILGTDGEISKKVTKTQNIEYNNQLGKIQRNSGFLFMYPVFNSNKILCALEDEKVGTIEIDFKQAFLDKNKNVHLEEFTQGGAFCNYNKILYFTGGKEKQKGIGKIFLRISFKENDSKKKLTKMPNMIYSHWNHSMISDENYVFAIGGYNSNKCECFNLKTLKWESMPILNCNERQRPMLAIHKDYLYAFMGYTQFDILDSIERINITNLDIRKWEKVNIFNPAQINLKFYGAGIYKQKNELYFIGGKVGRENEEDDYKKEIYSFNFEGMEFSPINISYSGKLNFIENQFHYCNNKNFGNFIDLNDGSLATISISCLNN